MEDIVSRMSRIYSVWCDQVFQWLADGWWFSLGNPFSHTNNTGSHGILLKVAKITNDLPLLTIIREIFGVTL